MVLRFLVPQETHSLDVIFYLVLFLFLVGVLRLMIIPWIRENPRIASAADLAAKLLTGSFFFFLISYTLTLLSARTIFSGTLGGFIFQDGSRPMTGALWDWVNDVPPRSNLYVSFFVPLFFSVVVVTNLIAKRRRASDLKSWIRIELEIDKMNPRTSIVTLMAHIVGFLGAFSLLKMSRLLLFSIFLLGISGIALSFVNWYVTTIVFERYQFDSENGKVRLIRKLRNRSVAWTLYNLSFLPFIWMVWGAIIMVVENFL